MNERVARIEARLRAALAPDELDIVDDSAAHAGHAGARSGGGHFNVYIVAAAFAGRSPIQRHRLVHQALADLMSSDIHALSIKALTPEERSSHP
ncbi:BolA protein [Plasticicumulans lactativorans]|uniref:BolA protein n=1 Tax=Plasticicumulans lactativorans TaxID=1133106 RepID=A0A4V2SDH1_9GAMM|nr:BolA family protein [Plasticicumulans lactativorans]TCO83488.1 BolA protein [Plasticicumulans lactativorans]